MVKYEPEDDFVGRDGIMGTIEKQLTEGHHRAALAGIGGVGNTRFDTDSCILTAMFSGYMEAADHDSRPITAISPDCSACPIVKTLTWTFSGWSLTG